MQNEEAAYGFVLNATLSAEKYAKGIPVYVLDGLPHPLETEAIRRLSLPKEIIRKLIRDPELRAVLSESIDVLRKKRWESREPSTENLIAYIHGELSSSVEPYIQAYLAHSEVGRDKYEDLLQRELSKGLDLDIGGVTKELEAVQTTPKALLSILFASAFLSNLRRRPYGTFL